MTTRPHPGMAESKPAASLLQRIHWFVMAALVFCSLQGYFAPDQYWAERLAQSSLVVLILQLATIARKFSVVSFELWFLLISWLFMFGQLWLVGFGRSEDLFYPLLLRYDTTALAEAGAFALCYMQALFLGLTISHLGESPPWRSQFPESVSQESLRLTSSLGWVLVAFALPFRLYEDLRNVFSAQDTGSFLAVTASSGAADDLSKLFLPGLLALLVSARNRPGLRRLYFLVGASYHVIIMVLTGDRRYAVTALMALGLCYLACLGAKKSWRVWLAYVACGLLLLNMLAYIRSIRQGGLTSLSTFVSEASDQLFAMNPLLESLSEFGVSLMSVVLAVIYIPHDVPYQLGYSYVGALSTLLPSGWISGIDLERVAIGDLLARLDGHAVGGSQAAEMFANFGWWGLLGGFVLGRLLVWVFEKAGSLTTPLSMVVYYSLFYILLNLVRAAFVEVLRVSVLVSIPVVLLASALRGLPSSRLASKIRRERVAP